MPGPAASVGRRRFVAGLVLAPLAASVAGCSDEVPGQRTSGTLVTPLESVEKAGESAGQAADAAAKSKKAAP